MWAGGGLEDEVVLEAPGRTLSYLAVQPGAPRWSAMTGPGFCADRRRCSIRRAVRAVPWGGCRAGGLDPAELGGVALEDRGHVVERVAEVLAVPAERPADEAAPDGRCQGHGELTFRSGVSWGAERVAAPRHFKSTTFLVRGVAIYALVPLTWVTAGGGTARVTAMMRSAVRRLTSHSAASAAADGCTPARRWARPGRGARRQGVRDAAPRGF